jgi:hypothetical protein
MRKVKFGLLALVVSALGLAASAQSKVVISQIYGGAGCGTVGCSSYKNDYIEIFNAGNVAQNLNGWSIQYAAAAGTAWQVTLLTNVTLQPGQYYLIAQGAGSNGVNNIPTPDASGTVAMSATSAKIALVSSTTALSGACPTSPTIVDFVGYGGSATCNEGGANAPAPSTTTAAVRLANGCTDANNNSADFTATTPNPRNTSTATAPCMTLPVSFVSFKAQYQAGGNAVTLTWSTAQEKDASEFVAERSADGNTWTTVAHVRAAGNSNVVNSYEVRDLQPQKGTNLYRIKQVDIDGRFMYTGVVGIRNSGKPAYFRIFPNPSEGTVFINADLEASAPVSIRVTDASGKILLNEQRVFNAAQPVKLELQRFGKGIYFIDLTSGDFKASEKVLVF